MPSHTSITKREKRLIELFGPETLNKDRIIEKKFALYFGDCSTKNRNFIRDARMKKKLRLLFGEYEEITKSGKKPRIIKNRKKSKKQSEKIQKRFDDLFGVENTKKDLKLAKKFMHLFGDE